MKHVSIISLIFLCFSCELAVDISVPQEKPKLTVNSVFAVDSLWEAHVSLSKFILDNNDYPLIDNAQVVIYQNETPIDTLINKGSGFYQSDTGRPVTNEFYTIVVQSDTYGEIRAESYTPSFTPIQHVEVKELDNAMIFTLTFEDNPDENNFYEIKAKKETIYRLMDQTERTFTTPLYLESDDPIFRNHTDDSYYNSLIFDDSLFPGRKISVNVKANNVMLGSGKVYVHLTTLSKDLYHFQTTLNLQESASGDPLATPVNVFNNVQKGYGIFGGYGESIYIYKK
jgi:hypothetical protein